MVMGKITKPENALHWCYLFFLYWENTLKLTEGDRGKVSLPDGWRKYESYFKNPNALKELPQEKALPKAEAILRLYADSLQAVILGCPPVKKGFHVYKVAGNYPGLPTSEKDVPKLVPQLPFNSTTVTPHFNFALFTPPDASGNLFHLHLPRGSRAIYIPSEYHAYPFEQEIILPRGSVFKIYGSYQATLNLIDPESVVIVKIQEPVEKVAMGPVNEMRPYEPCKGGQCKVTQKPFRIYSTRLESFKASIQ